MHRPEATNARQEAMAQYIDAVLPSFAAALMKRPITRDRLERALETLWKTDLFTREQILHLQRLIGWTMYHSVVANLAGLEPPSKEA